MTSPGSESRIRWCGDANDVIRAWPADVRFNIGGDLERLEKRLEPLDFASMGSTLPGVFELRDRDAGHWYRLLYIHLGGLVYVLHCFTKTTNQTAQSDINIARTRLRALQEETLRQKEGKHDKRKKHR